MTYEPRMGQSLEVEDAQFTARSSVTFEPRPEEVKITLALEYGLKDRDCSPLVDRFFIRRRWRLAAAHAARFSASWQPSAVRRRAR